MLHATPPNCDICIQLQTSQTD